MKKNKCISIKCFSWLDNQNQKSVKIKENMWKKTSLNLCKNKYCKQLFLALQENSSNY